MDVVTGDFVEASPNIGTQFFSDLDTVFGRMDEAGATGNLGDFQYFVTNSGRLSLIDAAPLGGNRFFSPRTAETVEAFQDRWASERFSALRRAPANVGRDYLESLRTSDPGGFDRLVERLRAYNSSPSEAARRSVAPYREFFDELNIIDRFPNN